MRPFRIERGALSSSRARPNYTMRTGAAVDYGADCVADNVNNSSWGGDAGRVIDTVCGYLRLHARRHVALRLRDDHSIVFGNQKPTRNVLPKRAPDRNSNAVQRYRPLHGGEHGAILRGSVLRECRREGAFGESNQTIAVRCKLWRLGMRVETIEHVRNLLALVGSKSSHVDQRVHAFGGVPGLSPHRHRHVPPI